MINKNVSPKGLDENLDNDLYAIYDELSELAIDAYHKFEVMKDVLDNSTYVQEHKENFQDFYKMIPKVLKTIDEMWYGEGNAE